MRTLHAWIDDKKVGAFTETPQTDGSTRYAFEYEEVTNSNIVSLTMVPIDGERRIRIEEARKIVRTDSFSLLCYVGGNPVNRVLFLPPGARPGKRPPPLSSRPPR